jgi:pectate lyase
MAADASSDESSTLQDNSTTSTASTSAGGTTSSSSLVSNNDGHLTSGSADAQTTRQQPSSEPSVTPPSEGSVTDASTTDPSESTSTEASDSAAGDAGGPPETATDEEISTWTPTSEGPAPTDCEGQSSEVDVLGYGQHATGGGAAPAVSVSTFQEATAALDAYRDAFEEGTQSALVLRYNGSFDFNTITDVCAQHSKESQILYIKEVNNVTFEGTAGSSANFGIKINRAKNVIVRNMTIGLLPGGGDSDAITIEGNGNNGDVEHVWIDHNDLFSSTKDDCDGAGDTEFDGLIDIKKGARFITVSYNKLHDHQKTGLLGSSDTDEMDRFVTFHHNWYENVVSRTPLHRFGFVHLFNNYFNRILDSGINVRMGGVALIEANYFSNAANPVTSRYSDEVGYWELVDNFVGDGVTWSETEDTLANASEWKNTAAFPREQLTYDYEVDAAECVKSIVTSRAGATLSIN